MPRQPLLLDPAHPALAGHFPGRPIYPGVLLLSLAAARIAAALDLPAVAWSVEQVKFNRPLCSGDRAELEWSEADASGALRFTIHHDGVPAVSGRLRRGPCAA